MMVGHCEICGAETSDGEVCRACLLGHAVAGDQGYLELPEELGGFQVLERVGRGGSGEVWRSFQPGPDREVALKVFLDHRLGGNADHALFLREAQSLGKLDHPHIVPVYATGEEGGFLFIASRWMAGGTLERVMREGCYRDKPREAAEAMLQIAQAVAHAHRHGLVHRDIKPANILLDGKRALCLADFGIAITEDEALDGVTSGTPAYMAPEQLAGEAVTTATDVWALGALMHEMLTGSLPRKGEVDFSSLLDSRLGAMIHCCLQREPSLRYDGAAGFVEDLEAYLSGRCVSVLSEGIGMRMYRWSRRHPALAATLVIALVMAGIAAGFGWKAWNLARESEARSLGEAALLREQAYVSDVYLASRALSDNQLGVAREMLARHGDGSGSASLRGFEWFALSKIAEGDPARIFKDHSAEVRALEIDPSGHFLLSAGRDGRVVVRELESGEVVLSLPREDAPKEAGEIPLMAILTAKSPEAKALLLSGEASMDEMRMRGRPSKLGELRCAAWSPDGKLLATGGDGCYLRLWSFPEGRMVGYLPQHPTQRIWFSDEGRLIMSLVGRGDSHELRVHDVRTLARLWSIDGVERGVAFSGDEAVVVKKPEMRMTVLSLENGEERRSWLSEGVADLAFVEDGRGLHGTSGDRRSQLLWDAKEGHLMKRVASVDGVINALLERAGGSVIAGEGQVVRIQNAGLNEIERFRGHADEIMGLAERGNWLVSGGKDRTVRVWNRVDEESGAPFFCPPGSTILGLSEDGESWLMDTPDAVEVWSRSGLKRRISGERRGLGLAADAKSFATWRKDGLEAVIEWWDMDDSPARDSFRLKLSTKDSWTFGWSRDGSRAAVSVGDRYVRIFDPRDGSKLGEITGLTLRPMRIIFSPNGKDIAFYGWPWSVQVGSLERGLKEGWRISAGTIGPVVFSPDGMVFAAGGDENKIIVRDLLTGEVVSELKGHKGQINSLAFTPDGKTLVSASSDRSLRLWHVPTWRDLGVLDEGTFHGYIGFDREGKRLTVLPHGRSPFAIPGWE